MLVYQFYLYGIITFYIFFICSFFCFLRNQVYST